MVENIFTLLMLILLQAVLGFDNLLYISLESKRAPLEKQSYVRKLGIGLAVFLRIGLLFGLVNLIQYVDIELFGFDLGDVAEGHFNLHSIIVLVGGIFILYTAVKEIFHMMSPIEDNIEALVGVKHTMLEGVFYLFEVTSYHFEDPNGFKLTSFSIFRNIARLAFRENSPG